MKKRNSKRRKKMSLKATNHPQEQELRIYLQGLHEPGGVTRAMARLQSDFATLRSNHRKTLLRQLAEAYGLAYYLRTDQSAWVEFCHLPEWQGQKKRPDIEKPGDALRYVTSILVGFHGRASYQKANKYHSALIGLLEEDIPPNAVAEKIKEAGGIEKLAKATASRRKEVKRSKKTHTPSKDKVSLIFIGEAASALLSHDTARFLTMKVQTLRIKGNTIEVRVNYIKNGDYDIYHCNT